MSYAYAQRKRAGSAAPQSQDTTAQPSLDALRSGAVKPTAAQMGHRVDLPDAMRAKMENAFGADLSAVKLYESEAVGDAGAEAITQGSNIAFAPGMLDFASQSGQALLGHELSHVVSQARGEVHGSGFLNDSALEARADREGAMAAAGQSVYGGPVAGALSNASATAAAGPMQARKGKKNKASTDPDAFKGANMDIKNAGKVNQNLTAWDLTRNKEITDGYTKRPEAEGLGNALLARYNSDDYLAGSFGHLKGMDAVTPQRLINSIVGTMGKGWSQDDIIGMFDNLMAPNRTDLDQNDADAVAAANGRFDQGALQLKGMFYEQLKRLEHNYGTLPSQLHPEDFIRMAGPGFKSETTFVQDANYFLQQGGKYFDTENNEDDRKYRDLIDYYDMSSHMLQGYGGNEGYLLDSGTPKTDRDRENMELQMGNSTVPLGNLNTAGIGGPFLSPKQQASYAKDVKKRAIAGGWARRLGRFR